jgi:hypothetical protein
MFVEWLQEYEKPNFRAISRLLKKLWQIYEFTVPGSSGTTGTAIQKKYFFYSKSEVPETTQSSLL